VVRRAAVRTLLDDESLAGLWFDRTQEYSARRLLAFTNPLGIPSPCDYERVESGADD